MSDLTPTIRAMAVACITRMCHVHDAAKVERRAGSRLNSAALDYCCGYASALEDTGDGAPAGMIFVMAARGAYDELLDWVREHGVTGVQAKLLSDAGFNMLGVPVIFPPSEADEGTPPDLIHDTSALSDNA